MPNNSPITRIPSIFDIEIPHASAPHRASSTDSVPPRLSSWFSSKIYCVAHEAQSLARNIDCGFCAARPLEI